jgi:putative SOS response-associated peptidase YedK
MCGQFALACAPEAVRARFGYVEEPRFPPRASILPTEPIALVVARAFSGGSARRFMLARWGFLPGFVRDVASFPLIVNARAETLAEKPSFAAAFKRRRALAPADGVWLAQDGERRLWVGPDAAPFGLAALFETYCDASGGEIDTACLITAQGPGGERLPVIVPPAAYALWLDSEAARPEALLAPPPPGFLRRTPATLR